MLQSLQETSINISVYNIIHILINVLMVGVILYVRSKINEFKVSIFNQNHDMEEKIFKIINGKYVKAEVYGEQQKNIAEKISEWKIIQENKFDEIYDNDVKIERKIEAILASQNNMSHKLAVLIAIAEKGGKMESTKFDSL